MSLVSYGDSDISDDESNDSNNESPKLTKDVDQNMDVSLPKVDNKSESDSKSAIAIGLLAQGPHLTTDSILSGEISDEEENEPLSDKPTEVEKGVGSFLHNNLPSPKSNTHIDVAVVLDDTLEDEVKPKESQMADAPKPPPKRTKQPVKIVLPKLNYEDDEEPKTKKVKLQPSTKSSGLTSLLPPPIHAARKEANRILVPHTLTKKTAPQSETKKNNSKTSKNVVSLRKMTQFQAMTGYESDSDDENSSSGNFFSLDSDSNRKADHLQLAKELPPCLPSAAEVLPNLTVTDRKEDSISLPRVVPRADPNAPLGFDNAFTSPYSLPSVSCTGGSVGSGDYDTTTQLNYNVPYQQYAGYNETYTEENSCETSEVDQYLQDEQFLRIQGKKGRGKEPIEIIDAKVDDYMNSEIEITKTLTEESENRSHRKKDSQPSSKQKRKHQITYLAFQAKERELELKNNWAQGRATKRQTQSKYGF